MKKLLLLIPACFILCGCPHMGPDIAYHYTIINNSEKTIEIIPFFSDTIDIGRKVIINNGNKIEKKVVASHPRDFISMKDLVSVRGGLNRVAIVFDNQKKIMYKDCTLNYNCNENPRNIFNYENNNHPQETYIISREDYENAIDCNGNCY